MLNTEVSGGEGRKKPLGAPFEPVNGGERRNSLGGASLWPGLRIDMLHLQHEDDGGA